MSQNITQTLQIHLKLPRPPAQLSHMLGLGFLKTLFNQIVQGTKKPYKINLLKVPFCRFIFVFPLHRKKREDQPDQTNKRLTSDGFEQCEKQFFHTMKQQHRYHVVLGCATVMFEQMLEKTSVGVKRETENTQKGQFANLRQCAECPPVISLQSETVRKLEGTFFLVHHVNYII